MRVEDLLRECKGAERRLLLQHIPKLPLDTLENRTGRFPYTLMTVLPLEEREEMIQDITKKMILTPSDMVLTTDTMLYELAKIGIAFGDDKIRKITSNHTTYDYLHKIRETRRLLYEKWEEYKEIEPIDCNKEVGKEEIRGNPDGMGDKTIVLIKTRSRLGENWSSYLLELYSYASLGGHTYTKGLLVLPLQMAVISFDMMRWRKQTFFGRLLQEIATEEEDE